MKDSAFLGAGCQGSEARCKSSGNCLKDHQILECPVCCGLRIWDLEKGRCLVQVLCLKQGQGVEAYAYTDVVLWGRPIAILWVRNHTQTVSMSKETTLNGHLPAQERINISAPWGASSACFCKKPTPSFVSGPCKSKSGLMFASCCWQPKESQSAHQPSTRLSIFISLMSLLHEPALLCKMYSLDWKHWFKSFFIFQCVLRGPVLPLLFGVQTESPLTVYLQNKCQYYQPLRQECFPGSPDFIQLMIDKEGGLVYQLHIDNCLVKA